MLNETVGNDTHAQISLQPIAAPSILGLYGLAGATFMVAAHMAHWFGDSTTSLYLFPFAAIFGGLAQFLAGMWAYTARDGVATAIHGMWGSFWMAYGVLNVVFAVGKLTAPSGRWPEIGFWFIVLAAITWVGVAAAVAENRGFVTLLAFLAAGSTTAAIGELTGIAWLMTVTGWLFIIASVPLGTPAARSCWRNRSAGKFGPWKEPACQGNAIRFSIGMGEPGVIRGQA